MNTHTAGAVKPASAMQKTREPAAGAVDSDPYSYMLRGRGTTSSAYDMLRADEGPRGASILR